jgi:hypothetical protein
MRNFAAVTVLAAMIWTNAQAQETAVPEHFRSKDIVFVTRQGSNLTLQNSINLLDGTKLLHCRSARGCMIVLNAAIQIHTAANYSLCAQLDGKPACQVLEAESPQTHQVAVAEQGDHTIQTVLTLGGGGGAVVDNWETDYTMYERGPGE